MHDDTRRWLRTLPLPLLSAAALIGAGWLARQDARAVSIALLGAGIALAGVWAGAEIAQQHATRQQEGSQDAPN